MHARASEAIKVQETENIKKDAVKVDDRGGKKWQDKRGAGKKGQRQGEKREGEKREISL